MEKLSPQKIAYIQLLLNDDRKPTYIAGKAKVARQTIHKYLKNGVLTKK